MAHSEKCPVCNGSGIVRNFIPIYSSTAEKPVYYSDAFCHGCNGKGWIVVVDFANELVNYVMVL